MFITLRGKKLKNIYCNCGEAEQSSGSTIFFEFSLSMFCDAQYYQIHSFYAFSEDKKYFIWFGKCFQVVYDIDIFFLNDFFKILILSLPHGKVCFSIVVFKMRKSYLRCYLNTKSDCSKSSKKMDESLNFIYWRMAFIAQFTLYNVHRFLQDFHSQKCFFPICLKHEAR